MERENKTKQKKTRKGEKSSQEVLGETIPAFFWYARPRQRKLIMVIGIMLKNRVPEGLAWQHNPDRNHLPPPLYLLTLCGYLLSYFLLDLSVCAVAGGIIWRHGQVLLNVWCKIHLLLIKESNFCSEPSRDNNCFPLLMLETQNSQADACTCTHACISCYPYSNGHNYCANCHLRHGWL